MRIAKNHEGLGKGSVILYSLQIYPIIHSH